MSRFTNALSWSCSIAGLFGTVVEADNSSFPMPPGMFMVSKAKVEMALPIVGKIPWFSDKSA